VLLERGFAIRYVDAWRESPGELSLRDLDPSEPDLLISLGGPRHSVPEFIERAPVS
jgi:hypothetical protein